MQVACVILCPDGPAHLGASSLSGMASLLSLRQSPERLSCTLYAVANCAFPSTYQPMYRYWRKAITSSVAGRIQLCVGLLVELPAKLRLAQTNAAEGLRCL